MKNHRYCQSKPNHETIPHIRPTRLCSRKVQAHVGRGDRGCSVNDAIYMALWDDREAMREALRPFAIMASGYTFEGIPDDRIVLVDGAKKLRAGDFRRAAKIYFDGPSEEEAKQKP